MRSVAQWCVVTLLVLVSYWNVWIYNKRMGELPPRASDTVVLLEERYAAIRSTLKEHGYQRGTIEFITNRTLKARPYSDDDNQRWVEAHYAMLPWTVVRDMRAVSGSTVKGTSNFVIGDFWDAVPDELPTNIIQLYHSGDGLILFKKGQLP